MGRKAKKIPTGIRPDKGPNGEVVYKIRVRHNRKPVRCGTYPSLESARDILKEIREKQALGTFDPSEYQTRGKNPQHSDGIPFFPDVVDQYLSEQRHLKPSSRQTYQTASVKIKEATKGLLWTQVERNHIKRLILSVQAPVNLEKIKLCGLDEDGDLLEDVIQDMTTKDMQSVRKPGRPKDSGGGVETIVTVLRNVFGYGIGTGLPVPKIDPLYGINTLIADRDPFLIKPYTVKEEQLYLSCLNKEPTWFKAWSFYMFRTGCRLGESLGLAEPMLDFEADEIRVWRQFHKGMIRAPKFNSMRTLRMCSDLKDVLLEWIEELNWQRKMEGRETEAERWIFPTWRNSKNLPRSPEGVADHYKNFLKQIGLPDKRVHDIRHSVATWLIRAGINYKIVAQVLGHRDPATTIRLYTHISPQEMHIAMETLVNREQRLLCPLCKRPMTVNAFNEELYGKVKSDPPPVVVPHSLIA